MIRDPNLLHVGQLNHIEVVMLRAQAAGLHVIFHRFRNTAEEEFVVGAIRLRPHGGFFPLRGALVLGENPHRLRLESDQARADHLVGALTDGAVARLHRNVVEGLLLALGDTAPEQRGAVAKEPRSGNAQPEEHRERGCGNRGETQDPALRGHARRLRFFRQRQSVARQQLEERIVGTRRGILGEGQQALLKLGELMFRRARGFAAIQVEQRRDQAEGHCQCQADEEQNPSPQDAGAGEGEVIRHQHRKYSEDQSRSKNGGRTLRDSQHPETPLDAGQVFRQPKQVHKPPLPGQSLSLPSTARCRLPSSDSAIPTASTASITYHQISLGLRSASPPEPASDTP